MEWIISVDEVGRGPLAGPVTVCTFALSKNAKWFKSFKVPIRDSKKLSAVQRELWLKEIKKAEKRGEVFYTVKSVGVKTIDRINIKQAADLAATRAFLGVLLKIHHKKKKKSVLKTFPYGNVLRTEKMEVILDAGLKINLPGLKQRSLPKADEKFPVVSLASIVAKVRRDKHMERLDRKYPGYGFAVHKGYGTAKHYRAIKKLGLSPEHRLTFLSNFAKLNKK